MEETFELTDQEIGEAITRYIAMYKKRNAFYPYRIIRSSLYPREKEVFVTEYIPKGSHKKDFPHRFKHRFKNEQAP